MSGPILRSFVAHDGLEISYSEWDNAPDGPLIVLVHATGFCKEVCSPVVDDLFDLTGPLRAIAIDQRAHGDSASPPVPFDWWDVGRDIVELAADSEPIIGVGHSAGGAALILAELCRPGTFQGLVLVEPIILPPPYGRFPSNPMAAGARRRRDWFPSREAAYENWRTKPAFADWQERALQAYVEGGLRPHGDGFTLKCSREAEAEFFTAATDHRAWDRLGEIEVETVLMAGEHSSTHREPFLREMAGRIGGADWEIVSNSGHMVWMERPETIAGRVARLVDVLR